MANTVSVYACVSPVLLFLACCTPVYTLYAPDIFCSKYYNYSVSNQGVKETHGDNYTLDYFTDVIKAEAVKFIEESSETPIFMYIATPAPHRPATPAPQYESKFVGQVAPRSPSYNFDSKDKHWIISEGKST
jgi:hypothetical protein